jgi:purine nucleosidase
LPERILAEVPDAFEHAGQQGQQQGQAHEREAVHEASEHQSGHRVAGPAAPQAPLADGLLVGGEGLRPLGSIDSDLVPQGGFRLPGDLKSRHGGYGYHECDQEGDPQRLPSDGQQQLFDDAHGSPTPSKFLYLFYIYDVGGSAYVQTSLVGFQSFGRRNGKTRGEVSGLPIPVWIDTDPGIDDALAIALAVRSPELRVLALSCVYGNGEVAATTRNARHLVERLGAEVPVYAGARRPLVRTPFVATDTHGEHGLGHAAVPPLPEAHPPVEAPGALLGALGEAPEPVTVVALGPLTNLALALALDRESCVSTIREIIWMGGSAGAPGNTTPVSEYNSWCDPEAALCVLESGIPVRMVGLDATRCVLMPAPLAERYGSHPNPEVRWWAEMWRFYVEFHRRSERLEGCILNDPLAIGLLLDPGLGRWMDMYVTVDCGAGLTRGQTLCDRYGFTRQAPNVSVCLEADGEAALALALQRGLGVAL